VILKIRFNYKIRYHKVFICKKGRRRRFVVPRPGAILLQLVKIGLLESKNCHLNKVDDVEHCSGCCVPELLETETLTLKDERGPGDLESDSSIAMFLQIETVFENNQIYNTTFLVNIFLCYRDLSTVMDIILPA
jgi:hypothetical protein